jgi:hypothetical protein
MTTKTDYTDEEWSLLARAPLSIAAAVIASDLSGSVGVAQEFMSMVRLIETTRQRHTSNELVNAVADATGMGAGSPIASAPQSGAGAITRAVSECREIAALLARKAPEAEAHSFARWLMLIAQTVAEAAREDDDEFGVGTTMVSENEIAAMHQMEQALGLMS